MMQNLLEEERGGRIMGAKKVLPIAQEKDCKSGFGKWREVEKGANEWQQRIMYG